jgi:hypothetical protein
MNSNAENRKPAQSKGKGQDCLIKAEATVKARWPNASHNSDNSDTSTNFLFYVMQKECWYDINVKVEDKSGACTLAKPILDPTSANCG